MRKTNNNCDKTNAKNVQNGENQTHGKTSSKTSAKTSSKTKNCK